MSVYVCLIIAVVALGSMVYSLVTGEVPLVVFFASVGKVTRHENPPAYWAFIISYLVFAIAVLFVAKRKGSFGE